MLLVLPSCIPLGQRLSRTVVHLRNGAHPPPPKTNVCRVSFTCPVPHFTSLPLVNIQTCKAVQATLLHAISDLVKHGVMKRMRLENRSRSVVLVHVSRIFASEQGAPRAVFVMTRPACYFLGFVMAMFKGLRGQALAEPCCGLQANVAK